jgi:hypothetical protein
MSSTWNVRASVAMAVALLAIGAGPAVAAEPDWQRVSEALPQPLTGPALERAIAANGEAPFDEALRSPEQLAAAVVVHTVNAKIVGDEEYRAFYGASWIDKATAAMETADNSLSTQFGIDFRSYVTANWTTDPDGARAICNAPGSLLDSLLTVSRGGADVVVGFSNNATNSNFFGCMYGNHVLLRLHGQNASAKTYNSWVILQHEFSHLFNAPDRSGSTHPDDVMEDPYNHPGFWCEAVGYQDFQIVAANAGKYD